MQELGANERTLELPINGMTLVYISYSNSNLMNSKWAVSLPVYFAGHFTGIVFRRQDAILVDSLDFALVTFESQPLASSECEQRSV